MSNSPFVGSAFQDQPNSRTSTRMSPGLLRIISAIACIAILMSVGCLPARLDAWSPLGPASGPQLSVVPVMLTSPTPEQHQHQHRTLAAPQEPHPASSRSWQSIVLLRGLATLLLCSATAHITRNAATAKVLSAASDKIALGLRIAVQLAICADLLSSSSRAAWWSSTLHAGTAAISARQQEPQHAMHPAAWQARPQHVIAGEFYW
jgi:hypothetical protein